MEKPKYLKNPRNGRVFPWTEPLAGYNGMILCDADGNPLNVGCVTSGSEPFKIPDVIHSAVGSSGLGDPENREQIGKMLDDAHKEGVADTITRKSLPYDGVVGIPEKWVPGRDKNQFEYERNLLLNNYSHDQVLELLDLWPRYINEKLDIQQHINQKLNNKEEIENSVINKAQKLDDSPFTQMHRELLQAIDYLLLIKQAIDAGPIEGLKMLAGNDAALGYCRREQLNKFAKIHAEESHIKRKKEWARWGNEASRLIVINPHLSGNKSELARRVKANLSLDEGIQAIRKRL